MHYISKAFIEDVGGDFEFKCKMDLLKIEE